VRNADEGQIQQDVAVLSSREDQLAEEAIARIAKRGRSAIPAVETALHSAKTSGRLNCIVALRRIGDAAAVPLLGHRAVHDEEEGVRKEAEITLRQWAGGAGPRAEAARAAVRAIEEAQGERRKG
jgi:hypothetical protein